ncbi:LrgB-like family-domain-containing protein [Lipomyces oligophaga]|uniref:LrgB-like family-domain-containing protein n=1 Tax=Lipomyces oligophaga TaxID=45792 RepID=UPI0034CF1E19
MTLAESQSPIALLAVDCINAIGIASRKNAYRLFRSYVLVPVGVIIVLLYLYAIHQVIALTPVNFPASVICMLLLFIFLLFLDLTIGSRKTASFSRIIDVPLGFGLRWINTFFTPSFVLLPLSPAVGGAEVGKIAAVFILGFIVTMAFTAYLVRGLQVLFKTSKRAFVERAEELPPHDRTSLDGNSLGNVDEAEAETEVRIREPDQIQDQVTESIPIETEIHVHTHRQKLESNEIELQELRPVFSNPSHNGPTPLERARTHSHRRVDHDLASIDNPLSRTETTMSVSETRFNRAIDRDLEIMDSEVTDRGRHNQNSGSTESTDEINTIDTDVLSSLRRILTHDQDSTADLSRVATQNSSPVQAGETVIPTFFRIGLAPSPRAIFLANMITQYLDTFLYTLILFTVGLPLHFVLRYSLIAHSTFSILMLFLGLRLPAKIRRVVHPIFTCSGLTILGIFVLALAIHTSLDDGLNQYSTGKTYLYLFDGSAEYAHKRPGAGDLFKSLLEVSIVSLALPMYRFRNDLKQHFSLIIIPNVVVGLITFFAYPPICYAIGISAQRSIAFIGRSVTLALALPVVQALDGSQSLVAVVAILSGIVGVLIGGYILKLLKVREDDYLTRGITLGINSSAVATAHLLTIDPRASALSSLSFVVFGTTLIILSAIPPIVHVMKSMVGL